MKDWQSWQKANIDNGKNRFLFREGKKFFEKEYQIEATVQNSSIKEMKSWGKTH
jgi:hypothetical protein